MGGRRIIRSLITWTIHWTFLTSSAAKIRYCRMIRTLFSIILYSLESLWNSLQEYPGVHLIISSFEHQNIWWPSDHPVTHRNRLCGASYFDHYSQFRTPFSIILYSLESLWIFLQEYPRVYLIWSSFERQNIRIPSDHPVTHRNQLHGASYFDHYSQLRTPISMILYSLESL